MNAPESGTLAALLDEITRRHRLTPRDAAGLVAALRYAMEEAVGWAGDCGQDVRDIIEREVGRLIVQAQPAAGE